MVARKKKFTSSRQNGLYVSPICESNFSKYSDIYSERISILSVNTFIVYVTTNNWIRYDNTAIRFAKRCTARKSLSGAI